MTRMRIDNKSISIYLIVRIKLELGHVLFAIGPPGFGISSIHKELSLNQIQLFLCRMFSSFWEATDRSMAREGLYFINGNV
jgi:hypothetical protein